MEAVRCKTQLKVRRRSSPNPDSYLNPDSDSEPNPDSNPNPNPTHVLERLEEVGGLGLGDLREVQGAVADLVLHGHRDVDVGEGLLELPGVRGYGVTELWVTGLVVTTRGLAVRVLELPGVRGYGVRGYGVSSYESRV